MTQGDNLVLIGMPGSGKSTVGRLLAERLGCDFVDTDSLVETARGQSLQAIVDQEGPEGVLLAEEEQACALDCHNAVIATGGSMVYSERAMTALRRQGTVVWLDVPLPTLQARVGAGSDRGLAMRPDQDLADLAEERLPLYARHADIHVRCEPDSSTDRVASDVIRQLGAISRCTEQTALERFLRGGVTD